MKTEVFDVFGETVKDMIISLTISCRLQIQILIGSLDVQKINLETEGVGNKYGRYFYNPDDSNEYKIDVILCS